MAEGRGQAMRSKRELGQLIAQIVEGASTEDAELWAFRDALDAELSSPADATINGEPAKLIGVDNDPSPYRGLMARCRRDGLDQVVSLFDVELTPGTAAADLLAAFRLWAGADR